MLQFRFLYNIITVDIHNIQSSMMIVSISLALLSKKIVRQNV